MILNMNQLRSFHLAAKLKSITNAARELMVTPPAVTMQVKQLEETVGIKLMYRDGNTISLTDVGKSVFKSADEIFGKIHKMEKYLTDLSAARQGELRIGCTPTPVKYVMPVLISEFKTAYPGIRIILEQGTSSEMVKGILDNDIELALMRYQPDDTKIKVRLIGTEEVVFISAYESKLLPVNEISVTQLSTLPLIAYKEGSGARALIFDYLRKFKVEPNITLESGSIELIKELVRQDNGISFMGKMAVEEDLKNGIFRAIRILEGSPTIQFGIGYLQRKYLSPAAWAFLRMVDKMDEILPSLTYA